LTSAFFGSVKNFVRAPYVEFVEHAANGQASDKLRNQVEPNEILGLNCSQRLRMTVPAALHFGLEAERLIRSRRSSLFSSPTKLHHTVERMFEVSIGKKL